MDLPSWNERLLAGRRRHLAFIVGCGVLVFVLWLSGGGRDAVRAESLAASSALGPALLGAEGEGAALEPELIETWRRTYTILDVAGLAQPMGLTDRLPTRVDVESPELDAALLETALRKAGLEPVASAASSGIRLARLHVLIERGVGGEIGVIVDYVGPTMNAGRRTTGIERVVAGPWWSILPPLLAVMVALFYGSALAALGGAVLVGGFLAEGGEPVAGVGHSLGYVFGALDSSFHLYILGFTIALVGMVQVAGRCGGNQGLIDAVSRFAKSARSTRVAVWFMGLIVFFDDYANSLVVGTSARPLTDRAGISRAKLAYLVDSTAAPVAGLALVSTWVGYEVGLFDTLATDLDLGANGFTIFIEILPTRFYCILALVFVVMGAWLGRDYGPMLAAERKARAGDVGALEETGAAAKLASLVRPAADVPARWYNAAVPVTVTLVAVLAGIAWDGTQTIVADGGAEPVLTSFTGWREVFASADNAFVMFWSSVLGAVVGIALAVGQRILSIKEALIAFGAGVSMMAIAVLILILAWCIQSVTKELGTSYYLVSVLEPVLRPAILPLVVFFAAAAVAFATGTSWGTMGILLPALIPLAWVMTGDVALTILCMGAVLDGAIFGDHCSPISDTTVMSSLAAGCDHVEHVRTQMPYAITVMLAASIFGYALLPLGVPLLVSLALGVAALFAVLMVFGRPVDRESDPAGTP